MSYLEILKNKQTQSPSKIDKAITLVESLTTKNIMVSYSDQKTVMVLKPYLLSDFEKKEITELSVEIIKYLQGDTCFTAGGTCTVGEGNFVIQDLNQSYRRLLVNKSNGTQSWYSFDNAATMIGFLFLRDRFNFIEKFIYSNPQDSQGELFSFFEIEWRKLLQTLCRFQFIIESHSPEGPFLSSTPFRIFDGSVYGRA